MSTDKKKSPPSFQSIVEGAGRKALSGGIPGAIAMTAQVTSLMWLRTTMNYQYRYGMSTTDALKSLYKEGGVLRFYKGFLPALAQGPLSRFGDTAANSGMLALLDGFEETKNLPVAAKTACASFAAGAFRIVLMPIDAMKTIMQVEGKNGLPMLGAKIKKGGPQVLFHGALGASGATVVGHFPWFFTHNYLQEAVPKSDVLELKLLRLAGIGFTSSVVSDTISNSLRVIKTTKQTAAEPVSYPAALKMVVDKDGYLGLFGRGLKTRIIANGMQGMLFTVIWKSVEEHLNKGGFFEKK